MTRKAYKIGIAGCGKVAHLHARAIRELENARLAAVWSRRGESARAFGEAHSAHPYDSVASMVESEDLDLVIVCTPHPFHKGPAVEAAAAGAHVLVEKPLAATLRDCDEMISACRAAGVQLGVVSQRRWYEPARRLKQAIEDGKIGNPILATVTMLGWRDESYYAADAWRGTWSLEGGGVLVNQAPHQLDLLLWCLGDVAEVYGVWRNLNHPSIEVEDTAVAIATFRSGAVGNIVVSNSQKPGLYGNIQVHGSNGASLGARTESGAMFIAGKTGIAEPPFNDLWTVPGEEGKLQEWKAADAGAFGKIDATTHYLKLQVAEFLEAIEMDRPPAVTGEAGRRVVELFCGIYRSGRSKAPASFPLQSEDGEHDMDGRLPKDAQAAK